LGLLAFTGKVMTIWIIPYIRVKTNKLFLSKCKKGVSKEAEFEVES
jgi:hypothetical protein